jgi:DNA-binding LytR/AlgR family response regulator
VNLHITICDDEEIELEYLAKLTQEWAVFNNITAVVLSFKSAEAFLFTYETDKSADILLLDIKMKQLDGVTLAKRLRAEGSKVQIVFITGLPGFIAEGYEVSALHYLMKPVSKEKLFTVLDKAVVLLKKGKEYILVETEELQTKVFHDEILYAEAFAHNTVIQTPNGGVETRFYISELEQQLGENFLRVHRSYLVGLRHIRQITKTDVILDNGKAIPLSRRRYNAVNQGFINYYKYKK